MILDRIENAPLYVGLNTRFAKAFEVLTDASLAQRKDGRYPLDGENIYYTIQKYTTKSITEGNLEAHRKYIDIQILLIGVELLGYAPLNGLSIVEEYNPEKDIAFYKTPDEITKVILEPGLFSILFPNDAHLPCRQVEKPAQVRKVVIKVRLG